jgi:hypothetical protein
MTQFLKARENGVMPMIEQLFFMIMFGAFVLATGISLPVVA